MVEFLVANQNVIGSIPILRSNYFQLVLDNYRILYYNTYMIKQLSYFRALKRYCFGKKNGGHGLNWHAVELGHTGRYYRCMCALEFRLPDGTYGPKTDSIYRIKRYLNR